ncbi:MAG: radical SAM protein [bacterium]
MARLIFFQLNHYELHGPESISSVLSEHGHQTRLVVPGLERDPLHAIEAEKPDVIGIGHTTAERQEALAWARLFKKRTSARVVLGGVDPTFQPELARDPAVDAVVRGEAEFPLLEIMDRAEENKDLSDIESVAWSENGELRMSPVRPLVCDLDRLPFPDKDLYLGQYRYFRSYPIKFFMASRGCPHGCTYCANKGLRKLYPNPADYVRFKSPTYLAEEIKSVLAKYPARTVGFNDDLFTHDPDWLSEFLPRYKDEIGLPFFCTARIDTMTDEKARLLSEGGCYTCWYGLESAGEATRQAVLGRKMKNQDIREGTRILHEHGILTQSYNMLNIPGESVDDALETLRFNIELQNDFVVASLFQPFPGTELTRRLIEDGKLEDPDSYHGREALSYFAFSPFQQRDTRLHENLQKLFILGHRHPRLVPLIKKVLSLPKNPLFDILFLGSFAIDYGRSHRLRPWEVVHYNLRHLWTTYLARNRKVPEG